MVKRKQNYKHVEDHDNNPFIAIPSSLAGIFLVITVLFLIFAKESLALLVSLIWGFVVLGIVAMFFAYQSAKKKK
jgi:VIT1/CCC1 family predicted Fe2+/Mn2+ transporter